MIAVPLQLNEREYMIFVVLDDENVERIRQYDPAEVNIAKTIASGRMAGLTLRDVVIGYATQEEIDQLTQSRSREEVMARLQHLSRGFAFRPGKGDHDAPYLSTRDDGSTKQ